VRAGWQKARPLPGRAHRSAAGLLSVLPPEERPGCIRQNRALLSSFLCQLLSNCLFFFSFLSCDPPLLSAAIFCSFFPETIRYHKIRFLYRQCYSTDPSEVSRCFSRIFREKPEWNGLRPIREANLAWANASYSNAKLCFRPR